MAARWRGAYGISGNRGASAFTNSSRSWPRARSRPAAGVSSASGLRRADQIPGPGFEVAAAAHVNSVNNPKKRIMLSAACHFLAVDFLLGHLRWLSLQLLRKLTQGGSRDPLREFWLSDKTVAALGGA